MLLNKQIKKYLSNKKNIKFIKDKEQKHQISLIYWVRDKYNEMYSWDHVKSNKDERNETK